MTQNTKDAVPPTGEKESTLDLAREFAIAYDDGTFEFDEDSLGRFVDVLRVEIARELYVATTAEQAEQSDRARLSFVIDKQGIIVGRTAADGVRRYQLYQICEYGTGFVLSGKDRWFDTPREAIDAALATSSTGDQA